MKNHNNQKLIKKDNFKILSYIFIFIIITITIVFYFLINKKNNQNKIISTITPTGILNSLKSTLKVSCASEEVNNGTTQWLSKKNDYSTASILTGINISLTNNIDEEYDCKYGNYSKISSITIDSLKKVQTTLDNFFQLNGFIKDENNSFEYYLDDPKTIDTLVIGYSKSDTKCLVSMYSRSNPFSEIFCGTINQEKTNWYQELYPFIMEKIDPEKRNNPENRIDITKIIDKYARGGANPPIGGGGIVWFAVKINNNWKTVWASQDPIPCQIVKKYNIPKDIYGNDCYSDYPQEYF